MHNTKWAGKKNSPGPDWVNCLAGLLQTPWHALEHEANNENNFTNDGVTRKAIYMCFMGVFFLLSAYFRFRMSACSRFGNYAVLVINNSFRLLLNLTTGKHVIGLK